MESGEDHTLGSGQEADDLGQRYETVVLTVVEVQRMDEWWMPMLRRLPEDIRRRQGGKLTATKEGWEIAVVVLEVRDTPAYHEPVVAACGEARDSKGDSYTSAIGTLDIRPGTPFECPFIIPRERTLVQFKMQALVFDLRDAPTEKNGPFEWVE